MRVESHSVENSARVSQLRLRANASLDQCSLFSKIDPRISEPAEHGSKG
jgi:hypothetical protein